MEDKFYVIKGLAFGLDGMRFRSTGHYSVLDRGVLIKVDELLSYELIGDRELTIPISKGGMFISDQYVEEIQNPGRREFRSDNPFGRLIEEFSRTQGDITLSLTEHENALHVSVRENRVGNKPPRTVWDGYFSIEIEAAKEMILEIVDLEDAAFELDRIKKSLDMYDGSPNK